MAKRIWKDRVVERPRTFNLNNNPDGSVTLIPAPGTIIQEGTPVNAGNLNGLEEDLESHEADNVSPENENPPHGINKETIGLGNVHNLKFNLIATTEPTNTDDASKGFSVGSRWICTDNQSEYVCVDNNNGNAVWNKSTFGGRVRYYTDGVQNIEWGLGYKVGTGSLVSFESDHVYLIGGGGGGDNSGQSTIVSAERIDFLDLKTIYVDWEGTTNTFAGYLGISTSSSKTTDYLSGTAKERYNIENGVPKLRGLSQLNVSTISTTAYLRVHATQGTTVNTARVHIKVFNIWGVKK